MASLWAARSWRFWEKESARWLTIVGSYRTISRLARAPCRPRRVARRTRAIGERGAGLSWTVLCTIALAGTSSRGNMSVDLRRVDRRVEANMPLCAYSFALAHTSASRRRRRTIWDMVCSPKNRIGSFKLFEIVNVSLLIIKCVFLYLVLHRAGNWE